MKKVLIFWTIGAVCAIHAAPVEWDCGRIGTKEADGSYTLNYSGTGWEGLTKVIDVQPGKIYKISWEAKILTQETPVFKLAVSRGKDRSYNRYNLFPEWTHYTHYIYTKEAEKISLRLVFDPDKAAKVLVRNTDFEEVNSFTGNLVPNGDFELPGAPGTFKSLNWKDTKLPVSIVSGQNFLHGERTLEFNLAADRERPECGFKTGYIPVEPGKTYELSYWAKSEPALGITNAVSVWSPFGHKEKHANPTRAFQFGSEWNEYKWEITIPADTETYPDLKECMAELVFITFNKNSAGKIWIDDFFFRQK